jgi:hypothetical protein
VPDLETRSAAEIARHLVIYTTHAGKPTATNLN